MYIVQCTSLCSMHAVAYLYVCVSTGEIEGVHVHVQMYVKGVYMCGNCYGCLGQSFSCAPQFVETCCSLATTVHHKATTVRPFHKRLCSTAVLNPYCWVKSL